MAATTYTASADARSRAGRRSVPLSKRLPNLLLTVLMSALAFLWLAPFMLVLVTSIRSQGELLSSGVFAFPTSFQLVNFERAWRTGHFDIYFVNSLVVTLVKVPLGIIIASLAAYPIARLRFPLSNAIFGLFLLGLAIPIHVTLLPLFIIEKQLGILNTLFALFPPYIAFGLPFQIFVLRGFFREIPAELVEAARIDGASEWTSYSRIMMPLTTPALATLFIIDSLSTWNEFLLALILINSDRWRTVPLGLLHFQGEFGNRYPELAAGILIAIAPILVIYLVFQRYLVSGLTAGAVRG
jgi:raffinose/stachyose/melibiose transport system permease protein